MSTSGYGMISILDFEEKDSEHPSNSIAHDIAKLIEQSMKTACSLGLSVKWLSRFLAAYEKLKEDTTKTLNEKTYEAACAGIVEWDI